MTFSSVGRVRDRWVLTVGAVVLAVAFVVAPAALAGGGHGGGLTGSAELSQSAAHEFVAFWGAGDATSPSGMNDLVDYWARYHVVKAVTAALLMIVLAVSATRLWRSFVDTTVDTRRRRLAGMAGSATTAGGIGAALLLMANVQGSIAPLSSVLSLVPSAADDPAVGQVRQQVLQQLRAGDTSRPALTRMISDFGTYHAVLAACAVVLAGVVVVLGVMIGRSVFATARSERATRRNKAVVSAMFGLVGVCVMILAAANIGNAVDPAGALVLFYGG